MNPRIFGALMVGSGLVAMAVLGTRFGVLGSPTPVPTGSVNVVATKEPLRQYIPTQDTNQDGVPDWQELLNETAPLELSDTETAYQEPETLTEQFAVEFFEDYMRNKSFGSFGSSPDELVNSASADLVAQAQEELYTPDDVTMTASNPVAVRIYANTVADIMLNYPLPEGTRNEVIILNEAITLDDESVLTELDPIIAAYSGMIADMENVSVPTTMVQSHLDLLNTYHAIHNSLKAMRNSFADPLLGLLRVQRYQDDANGLANAITNLFRVAYQAEANFQPGDSAFAVVEFSE